MDQECIQGSGCISVVVRDWAFECILNEASDAEEGGVFGALLGGFQPFDGGFDEGLVPWVHG